MNILHITSITNPDGNGVAVAVKEYIKYESKEATVGLYNLEGELAGVNCPTYSYNKYKNIKSLPEPFCKPDLVIFNEVYKPKYINLYKECLQRKIKYIIIPHGCLVTEAQKKHRLKKLLGNLLMFNNFIYRANAIQFLNEREYNNSKSFKLQKFIISGNGIDISNDKINNPINKNFIYIGRYSLYIKGLDLLVEICKEYHEWFRNNKVVFNLYGRDSLNSISELKKMIIESNVEDIIFINDAVYDKEKEKTITNAYAFIQLSRHEGQPMGIIEALAHGLPCIVTYGTSFGEYINKYNCGFGCNFDKEEIFEKIKEMFNNQQMRNTQSQNAYKHAREDFNWEKIISKLIKEYKEV